MVGCSLFATLSPVISMHGKSCVFRKHGETAQEQSFSSLQSRRERGRTFFRGVANNTPYYGCCTLSGLPSESKPRSFSQKLNVVHASLRE